MNIQFDSLSNRCSNRLKAAGIATYEELSKRTESDLLSIPGFHRKTLNDLKEHLRLNGIGLTPGKCKNPIRLRYDSTIDGLTTGDLIEVQTYTLEDGWHWNGLRAIAYNIHKYKGAVVALICREEKEDYLLFLCEQVRKVNDL